MLPNFFIVGAQKAGTTSLHNYLAGHPDIYLPVKKETKFFIRDKIYRKGILFYEKEYFSAWKGESAVGEVDPDYMYYESALDRICEHVDPRHIKFIFLLRNPIDRAFSHYLMTFRRGLETLSFENAIEQEPSRLAVGDFDAKAHYSYVSRGFYLHQIERFLERVRRPQVLFLLTDDLKNDPETCLVDILQFLNVSIDYVPADLHTKYHKASLPKSATLYRAMRYQSKLRDIARIIVPSKKGRKVVRELLYEWNTTSKIRKTMTLETRQDLLRLYREENNRLGELIGRDLRNWNK